MSLKNDLKDWTEIHNVLIHIGKNIGIYPPELTEKEIPKYVLWSSSEKSRDMDLMSEILNQLIKIGALKERDGKYDYEFRWNPDFKVKWIE